MALWTPADLAVPPVGWFDASDAATITLNGSNVSAWANKGTLGGSASQATAANQPVYSASGLNGLPEVAFTTNDILVAPVAVSGIGNSTMFAVMRVDVGGNNEDIYVGLGQTSATRAVRTIYRAPNSGTLGYATWASDIGTSSTSLDIGGAWHVFGTTQSGTSVTIERDATAQALTLPSAPLVVAHNLISIGSLSGSLVGNYYAAARYAEVIVLNYAASAAEREFIQGYLAWKYGLQANLPGGHRYKDAAPTTGGGGAAVDLAGAATAGAAASASLSTTVQVQLAGAAVSAVTAAGAVTQVVPLAGAAVLTGAAAAALAKGVPLGASAVASASAAATLTHGVPLAGAAAVLGAASASLTVGGTLAGAAQVSSSAGGALSLAVLLSGAAVAQAAAAAGLSVTGATSLAGAATGGGLAAGTLTLQVRLSGSAAAAAAATGALSSAGAASLAGAAGASAQAIGLLTVQVPLTAAAVAAAQAAGALSIAIPLAGAALAGALAAGSFEGRAVDRRAYTAQRVTATGRRWRVRSARAAAAEWSAQ